MSDTEAVAAILRRFMLDESNYKELFEGRFGAELTLDGRIGVDPEELAALKRVLGKQ